MTRQSERLTLERHLVVVFDICSSTVILEDLKQTDNVHVWRNLLIDLKDQLVTLSTPLKMQIYKFIGDGWILLFPVQPSREELQQFLQNLSVYFDVLLDSDIQCFLQHPPKVAGLTFGVDSGELVKLTINEQTEYLGRAINVASRLQAATKELGGNPAYKALFSKHAYYSLDSRGSPDPDARAKEVRLSLKNLSNDVECDFVEYRVL